MSIAYLNGEWQPIEETRVSVLDRGFMFGDGVYEVIPVYGSRPFAEQEHLTRLHRSLGELRICAPMSDDEWHDLFAQAISRGGEEDALLYVQVTRGIAEKRSHIYDAPSPTVLITASPLPVFDEIRPYRAVTKQDFRWGRGDIKVISLVANALLKNEALAEGFDEAILLRDDKVTETTSSNVFIVTEGVIVTPPASNFLLNGVTRTQVIGLAQRAGMSVEERDISRDELAAADEVWITSTSHEVWPIGSVNGVLVGDGKMGARCLEMRALFQELKSEHS